jgi:hypothetical protein
MCTTLILRDQGLKDQNLKGTVREGRDLPVPYLLNFDYLLISALTPAISAYCTLLNHKSISLSERVASLFSIVNLSAKLILPCPNWSAFL